MRPVCEGLPPGRRHRRPLQSRPGFVFAGWSADSGAEYPDLAPGTLLALENDVTLYAVWEAETEAAAKAGAEDEPAPAEAAVIVSRMAESGNRKSVTLGWEPYGSGPL